MSLTCSSPLRSMSCNRDSLSKTTVWYSVTRKGKSHSLGPELRQASSAISSYLRSMCPESCLFCGNTAFMLSNTSDRLSIFCSKSIHPYRALKRSHGGNESLRQNALFPLHTSLSSANVNPSAGTAKTVSGLPACFENWFQPALFAHVRRGK